MRPGRLHGRDLFFSSGVKFTMPVKLEYAVMWGRLSRIISQQKALRTDLYFKFSPASLSLPAEIFCFHLTIVVLQQARLLFKKARLLMLLLLFSMIRLCSLMGCCSKSRHQQRLYLHKVYRRHCTRQIIVAGNPLQFFIKNEN